MTIRTEVPSLPRQPVATRVPLPRVRPAVAALIAANLATVTFFLLSYSPHGISVGPYRVDLDVYRIGSAVWRHGGDLYGLLPRTSSGAQLPFSYPPFAAMVMSPLTLLPMKAAGVLCTLVTIALTALVLGIFLRSVGVTGRHAVAWLLPAALLLEPVRNTLNYGQVNVALMALVTADCLVSSPRWPRGALTGIAAAVKLTPAAFVLFFLLRRDRRAALTAAVSFAACTGAGFLLAGRDSTEYWTSVLFQSGRPGSPAYAANQSILGVIARAGLDPHSPAGTALWLTLSAAVVVAACRGMRRALAASEPAWALSLNAFAALLICPISWSHHWVWGETAVLILAVGSRHWGRLKLAAVAVGVLLFAVAPQWWFPDGGNRELHWAAWEQVVGDSYVIYAAVILIGAALWGTVSNFPDSPASATYPEIASPAWQARWPTGLGRAGSPGFAVPAAGGSCCRWLSWSPPLRARSPGWCSSRAGRVRTRAAGR